MGKLNFTWRKPNFTGRIPASLLQSKNFTLLKTTTKTTALLTLKIFLAVVAVKCGSIVKKIRLYEAKLC